MSKFPGMVVPSKDRKKWTFTYRQGESVTAEMTIVNAEEEDPTKVYPSAPQAKSAMRDFCGLGKRFF